MNKIEYVIFDRMNFWMKELIKLWKNNYSGACNLSEKEFRDISESVRDLSKGLTGERALVGKKYLTVFSALGAYLLYYWPVSYAQTRFVLSENMIKGETALDIGAGPGPCSIAMLDHGFKNVTAYEKVRNSTLMLRKLSNLTKGNVILKEADFQKTGTTIVGNHDLIFMGHFINELWPGHENKIVMRTEFIMDLFNNVKKEGKICIIEPALTNTSRDLIKLRNNLIKNKISVLSPCVNKGECKIINENENATCHTEIDWKINPVIKRISQMAGIRKDILKFSYLILQKNAGKQPAGVYLVISDKLISKNGKIRFFLCGKEGRISLSLNEKNREMFRDSFLRLKRGDRIKINEPEIRDNGLMLNEKSRIEKV